MKYLQRRPTGGTQNPKTDTFANKNRFLLRHWKAIAAILGITLSVSTFIANITGTTNNIFSLIDRFKGQPPATSSGATPTTHEEISSNQPTPSGMAATAEASPSAETGCYDGDTLTPCSSPHSREVFAKPADASCDEDSLILYMGGITGVDLLGSDIDIKPLENTQDRCVIEKQSGMPTTSLKDIWTVDNDHDGYKDGGEFRRCFNRQGQAASCDTDHASEEFYDAPDVVDCGKKYEEFSGRAVDRSIRIVQDPRNHRYTCRAEVQVSSDRLTSSVRDLGNSTLPIKQN